MAQRHIAPSPAPEIAIVASPAKGALAPIPVIFVDPPKGWLDRHKVELDWAVGLVGILGFLAGVITLYFGAKSYLTSAQSSRSEHMHSLFRDYLRFAVEHGPAGNVSRNEATADHAVTASDTSRRGSTIADVVGFRLYTLEEMNEWIDREEAWALSWIYLFRRRSRRDRLDYLKSWRNTVRSHLAKKITPDKELLTHLDHYRDCYGLSFLQQVGEVRQATRATIEKEYVRRGRTPPVWPRASPGKTSVDAAAAERSNAPCVAPDCS